jgi:hypothetical protein
VKGKLVNGVGSQYSSHYLGTWCRIRMELPFHPDPARKLSTNLYDKGP